MGKGALQRRPPARARHDRLLGHSLVNDMCLEADVVLAIGTRFAETDGSSWYRDYTFHIPPTELIHIDIEPSEIGRNFPVEVGAVADARRRAAGARPGRPSSGIPDGFDRPEAARRIADVPHRVRRRQRARWRRSDDFPMMPGADPRRRARRPARRRLPRHRRRLEQERRRSAVPDPLARHGSHAGWLRHDGVRAVGGDRGQAGRAGSDRSCHWSATVASGRTRRCSPPPSSTTLRDRVGGDEQQRLRHHRRTAAGALRHDVRHHVPWSPRRPAAATQLCGARRCLRGRLASASRPPPTSARPWRRRSGWRARSSSTWR